MNVEQSIWLDSDDDVIEVKAKWLFVKGDRCLIEFPNLHISIEMSQGQAKDFAEEVMNAVASLLPVNRYAGDKTKGDAFAALRRADK